MRNSADSPLLARVRAGLDWPAWEHWDNEPLPPVRREAQELAIDLDAVRDEVSRRHGVVRTVAQGGPYIESYDERVAARIADDSGLRGGLAGWTFAIKDLVAVAGHRMTAGSPVRADARIERHDAPIVQWLESNGAVATGSVTLHEFAFGVTGLNPHAGTAPNPAAPGRCAGGSSSGSASAVADGSARIAIGTDTGGSVRIPAAFCGVVGFKPAHSTYPNLGVYPLSTTLDHVGFFAASVNDLWQLHKLFDPGSRGPDKPFGAVPKIAYVAADLDAADSEVATAFTRALDQLSDAGHEVVEASWPDPEQAFVASTGIMFSEAAAIHASQLDAHRDRYGDDIVARLELGAALSGPEVAAAHRLRAELIDEVHETLRQTPVIVSPTVPVVAPTLEEGADPAWAPRIVANTRLANVVAMPALSLPIRSEGPPVGMQVLGLRNDWVLGQAANIAAIVS